MQRSELAGTVLQLKALGIDNMMRFHWLAPPPAEAMVRALELLHSLGALNDDARYSLLHHGHLSQCLKPVACKRDPSILVSFIYSLTQLAYSQKTSSSALLLVQMIEPAVE